MKYATRWPLEKQEQTLFNDLRQDLTVQKDNYVQYIDFIAID